MRGILGVVLLAVTLARCGGDLDDVQRAGGYDDASNEGAASEGAVEAMRAPLPPPFCAPYVGAACSRSGERFDCMWDWTDMGTCYCNGSSWQCF